MGLSRSTSTETQFSEAGPPKDVGNLAVLTYFALGLGYLLPWNAFITAVDYFEHLYPNSHIDRVLTVSYLFPALIVLCVLLTHGGQTSSRFRINVGLAMLLFSTLAVPLLDVFVIRGDGDRANFPAHFVTVLAVAVAGMGDALVQASIIGGAGELPDRYMQAIVSGTAGCGVLISLLRIATKAALPPDVHGLRTSANVYFFIGAGFIILCIVAYNWVHNLPVMIHYESRKAHMGSNRNVETADFETDSSTLLIKTSTPGSEDNSMGSSAPFTSARNNVKGLIKAFVPLKWLSVSFLLVYVITLSIFPGFLAEDVHSTFLGDWYGILLITTFNVFDLVGKSATVIYTPDTQQATVIGSIARLLFFPLFAACLHGPKALGTEGPVFFLTGLLGLTNGYFTSAGFITAPKIVARNEIERAGTIMVISLFVGLTLGSFASWVWII